MQLKWMCALLFLAGNAVWDLRSRQICLWYTILFAAEGCGFCAVYGRDAAGIAVGCVPGLLLLCVSFLTGGMIGCGDGIAFIVLALFLDLTDVALCGAAAFFLSAFAAGFLLLKKHRGRDAFPFVPFLFAGCLVAACL